MELVTVFTTLNLAEADLVAAELEAAGFDVHLPDEFSAQTWGSVGGQTNISAVKPSGLRVQVPSDRAAEARALIEATVGAKEPAPTTNPDPSATPS